MSTNGGKDDFTLRQFLSGILYSKEEGTTPRDAVLTFRTAMEHNSATKDPVL